VDEWRMMVVIGKGFSWFVEAFPSIEVAVDREFGRLLDEGLLTYHLAESHSHHHVTDPAMAMLIYTVPN
jgi:hypothetical protein